MRTCPECFWTRARGPRGSPRQGGREPWEGGGFCPPWRFALVPVPLLPGPWPSSVLLRSGAVKRGQGLGDQLLLVPPPQAQSSLLATRAHGLPARIHRTAQVTHKEKWARLG